MPLPFMSQIKIGSISWEAISSEAPTHVNIMIFRLTSGSNLLTSTRRKVILQLQFLTTNSYICLVVRTTWAILSTQLRSTTSKRDSTGLSSISNSVFMVSTQLLFHQQKYFYSMDIEILTKLSRQTPISLMGKRSR